MRDRAGRPVLVLRLADRRRLPPCDRPAWSTSEAGCGSTPRSDSSGARRRRRAPRAPPHSSSLALPATAAAARAAVVNVVYDLKERRSIPIRRLRGSRIDRPQVCTHDTQPRSNGHWPTSRPSELRQQDLVIGPGWRRPCTDVSMADACSACDRAGCSGAGAERSGCPHHQDRPILTANQPMRHRAAQEPLDRRADALSPGADDDHHRVVLLGYRADQTDRITAGHAVGPLLRHPSSAA